MKTKILLSFAILFFIANASNAQIGKAKVLLGGSGGFYSNKNSQSNYYSSPDYKGTNFNIQLGKAININNVVGIILSYGFTKSNTANYPDSNLSKTINTEWAFSTGNIKRY